MNKIEKYLIDNGYNPALNGFDYCIRAVTMFRDNPSYKRHWYKLYEDVGKEFGVNGQNIERGIRYFKGLTIRL